jgi:metallophosphoesterase (TIGR03767 family)
MQATRRSVLKGVAAAAAVATTAGVQAFPRRSAAAEPLARPEGTTLASTVQRGPAGDGGYRRLVSGPGEPHVVRDDLGTAPRSGRETRRRPVQTFAHLTDIHVIDAQSPARVEFLDRYDDEPRTATIFSSAYRPHEFLCTQLADGVLAAVRRVGVGPVTGAPLGFALCTGDNTDNQQYNELRWHLDLMDGTRFAPNSGGPSFEGVHDQDPVTYDIHYWHPDGTPEDAPPTATDDNARRLHGFPTLPGLLDVAIAAFTPTGVGLPWYSCYGNHDGLVQGNFPATFQLGQVAVGPAKVVSLPAGVSQDDLARGDAAAFHALFTGPARLVTPDEDRRLVSRKESVEEHFKHGGVPFGHGFTAQNVADGTAYYAFDPSPNVRGIVLDSVNPNGESSGSLDATQFAWLREQLQLVSGPGRNKLVVVFSHHSISSMTNAIPVGSDDPADFGPRVLGPEVAALLLQFPNVVLMVDGHTHRNQVFAHTRPGGGGFWEVNTAAHIDFPCQARLMEIVDNRDGTLSIFSTVVDADADLVPPSQVGPATTVRELTSLARELTANDWQDSSTDRRGADVDRNVELLIAAPFPLAAGSRPAPARERPAVAARPGPELAATGASRPVPARGERPAVAARSGPELAATGGGAGVATVALGTAGALVLRAGRSAGAGEPADG